MEQKMEAILIDPHTETVSVVDYNGDYRQIYDLIGDGCRTFTTVNIRGTNDAIFLDDEGLLRDEPTPMFLFAGYQQPLFGRGVVIGADDFGEAKAPTVTLQQIKDSISFLGYSHSV